MKWLAPQAVRTVCTGAVAATGGLLMVGGACAAASLCQPEETPVYACWTGAKMASLCAAPSAETAQRLTYRYGTADLVELTFVADREHDRTFSAFSRPARPGAQIHQVWFELGKFEYLMTECSGGNCVSDGRLAVFRDQKLIMNAQCKNTNVYQPSFSRALIELAPDPTKGKSLTPLIQWSPTLFPIEELYRTEAQPSRALDR